MKFFATVCLFLLFAQLNAQSVILLEQDSVTQINQGVDISNNFKDFPIDLFFKNNTNDSIAVNWRRELGENCPLAWDIVTADQFFTYVPTVNQSQVPIPMTPADSHFIIRQIFFPRSVAGCCDLKVIFSLEGDPNPIDTGYYHIEINPDNCGINTTLEDELEMLSIYPTLAEHTLTIENGHLVDSIEILDARGRVCLQGIEFRSGQVDISSLAVGVYYLRIVGVAGGMLVKRVVKL